LKEKAGNSFKKTYSIKRENGNEQNDKSEKRKFSPT